MNLFDWLKQINHIKSPSDTFSDDDWEQFNAYMIHRFVSMDRNLLELANYAQMFQPTDKKQIYEFYKEYIPSNKRFNKYIKAKSNPPASELLQILAEHYEVSKREVKDYIKMLDKKAIVSILSQRGYEDKQIKKLFK